jgi:hypothetical protein
MATIVTAVLCGQLVSCVSTPQKKPPLLAAAERHNARGMAAVQQKRYAVADKEFASAYATYASMEDFSGMITVLINSSRLYRKQGDINRAATVTGQAQALVGHAPGLAAEVWFERGKIEALRGDAAAALRCAGKARETAGDDNRAMILNFSALLTLQQGDIPRGEHLADAALKESRSRGNRHEEANALCTLAEAALARGAVVDAERDYLLALAIHKELADPDSIHGDLKGLAAVLQQGGNRSASAGYLVRAGDVALSSGDTAAAERDYTAAAALYAGLGDRGGADDVTSKLKRLRGGADGSSRP